MLPLTKHDLRKMQDLDQVYLSESSGLADARPSTLSYQGWLHSGPMAGSSYLQSAKKLDSSKQYPKAWELWKCKQATLSPFSLSLFLSLFLSLSPYLSIYLYLSLSLSPPFLILSLSPIFWYIYIMYICIYRNRDVYM